jgi:hypothetical protein
MLIPFGVLSAAGAGEVSEGAFELIATATGTGSSGVIDFTSIPQTYKHLQIRYVAKGSINSVQLFIRLNLDAGSSYRRHSLFGSDTTVSSAAGATGTSIELAEGIASSTTTNLFAAGIVDLLDYSSNTKNTTARALYGQVGNINRVYLGSGAYFNTDSITDIRIQTRVDLNNYYTTSSRISLYGIKG